ncbi:uncharacterized protein [Venturia canescens]|uniref:uncharacterized protein n=1 Tax=Venturia canescens TaxID=32260 RepID=UPI001C9D142C|nr:uncharacterized protein LOC122416557 [Venturia canescens]
MAEQDPNPLLRSSTDPNGEPSPPPGVSDPSASGISVDRLLGPPGKSTQDSGMGDSLYPGNRPYPVYVGPNHEIRSTQAAQTLRVSAWSNASVPSNRPRWSEPWNHTAGLLYYPHSTVDPNVPPFGPQSWAELPGPLEPIHASTYAWPPPISVAVTNPHPGAVAEPQFWSEQPGRSRSQPTRPVPLTVEEHRAAGNHTSGPITEAPIPRYPVTASSVLHLMRKWNISFSGKRGDDVETFLTRISEGRALVPVSDVDLIRCIPFFLTGVALQWYRNDKDRWENWSQFASACRLRFGDPDYQYALREEIMRRTQGLEEPVADYLTCLRGLFSRLQPPWDEAQQIQHAHRNLIPRLHVAIQRDDVFDFDSFEHVAVRVEKSFQTSRSYRAPPAPNQSLCPELAYSPVRSHSNAPARKVFAAVESWPDPYASETSGAEVLGPAQVPNPPSCQDVANAIMKKEAPGRRERSRPTQSANRTADYLLELRQGRSPFQCLHGAERYLLLPLRAHRLQVHGVHVRGKPLRAGPSRVTTEPAEHSPPSPPINNTPLEPEPLSCGTLQTKESPTAFFVTFTIQDQPVRALVDSGSSRTFLGPSAIQWVTDLRIPRERCKPRGIEMAGGQRAVTNEVVNLIIRLHGTTFRLTAYLLPVLVLPCILGLDFMSSAYWVIDFASHRWFSWFEPQHLHSFEVRSGPGSVHHLCCGLRELTTDQASILDKLVTEEIPPAPEKPGCTSLTEHHIDVGGHAAIKQRYYAVSPAIEKAVHEAVTQMLNDEIIEPSSSDWSSPIVMVKKANGKLRFCLDFRKVNSVTKKDAYPIPLMNSILDRLRQANYITTLDLSQAYSQIPLAEDSREITAFTVPGMGLFQFRRMPFGLTNAPLHFNGYSTDYSARKCSRTAAGLTINPEKSEFCCAEVKYLGFLVNRDGLQIDAEKVAPVVNYPVPRNVKQLRRFLGMASWYRRFIPAFATHANPLTSLLKKTATWNWGEAEQRAFNELRDRLTTAPTLSCPNFELPFFLQTDASGVGLGAVLTQNVDDIEHVIAYASRALNNPTGRLGRWALEMQEYNYEVVHRKGALYHVPDALSRIPEETCALLLPTAPSRDRWYNNKKRSVRRNPDHHPNWRVEGGQLYYHRPPQFPALEMEDLDAWKLVLPSESRQQALYECHDVPQSGHLGMEKTFRRLSQRYHWPNMFREVAKYIRKCEICQRCKVDQALPVGLMGQRVLEQP